jgi:hypothetical protein
MVPTPKHGTLFCGIILFPRGELPEWPMGTDCKSVSESLRWFESNTHHHSAFMERISNNVHNKREMSKILIAIACLLIVVGCSSTPATESTDMVKDKAAAGAEAATTTAKMEKCTMCQSEFDSKEMVEVDGKKACKACAAMHAK